MICIIALIVFGIMSIFSATHRQTAKEAFDCVFRKVTLRPCVSNLDQRMKAGITGKIMTKSPKLAGFVHKYFEIISWIFLIITIVSLIFSAQAVYNLSVHGTCDPENPDQCVFTSDQCGVCGKADCEAFLEGKPCTAENCPDANCAGDNCTKDTIPNLDFLNTSL